MNDVPATPPPPPDEARKRQGSIAGGIGLAWLIAIAGLIVSIFWINTFGWVPISLLVLLVIIAIVLAAVGFYTRKKPRTGHGVLLGLVSIVAIVLLLVAACFGLLTAADFSGMAVSNATYGGHLSACLQITDALTMT